MRQDYNKRLGDQEITINAETGYIAVTQYYHYIGLCGNERRGYEMSYYTLDGKECSIRQDDEGEEYVVTE
jgi:hypothetical protein